MKKIILLILGLFLLKTIVSAEVAIPEMDKQQIINNLNMFVELVNKDNIDEAVLLISSNNSILQTDIKNKIRGVNSYQFDYSPLDENIEIINENSVKIKGRFSASGMGWTITGLSNYYVFEKSQNGEWLITDTNFTEKLGFDYIKNMLFMILPFFLLFFAFWLLMLIDCIKRNFEDKALWVVLMLFLNIIASILYYFMIKRKNITRKPLEFKM